MGIAIAMSLTGCYSWVDIKPSEAPKLNGSYSRVTGSVSTPSGTVTTVERTVAHVETPDGTLTEITGDFDARLTTNRGTFTFEHPVNAEMEEDELWMRSSNRPPTRFALREVQSVEVSQYDPTASVLIGTASILAGLLLFGFLYSSSTSD
jgi:hypothetical protein